MTDEQRQRAFDELLAQGQSLTWTLCLRVCGREDLARDAFQETWLAAWRALPGFRGEAKATTWLWRIAVRACGDTLRRERRGPRGGLDEGPEPADEAPTPAERLERSDLAEWLLAALTPRQRALVHLRYTQELAYEDGGPGGRRAGARGRSGPAPRGGAAMTATMPSGDDPRFEAELRSLFGPASVLAAPAALLAALRAAIAAEGGAFAGLPAPRRLLLRVLVGAGALCGLWLAVRWALVLAAAWPPRLPAAWSTALGLPAGVLDAVLPLGLGAAVVLLLPALALWVERAE